MALTLGSLFSGSGGIELGLARAGMQTLWQVEINKKCHPVLNRRFPNTEKFFDVKTVGKHNLKRVNVLAGGFPCQDIAATWDGPGLEGKRSGLWFEYHRIIGELQPECVLIENVGNLRKRGLEIVLSGLSDLGYHSTSAIISASSVGCPHERKRLWILGWREWEPVKFAADLPACECCDEPFCTDCQEHFGDCACPGPHSEDGWRWVGETPFGFVAYPDVPRRFQQWGAGTVQEKFASVKCFDRWLTEPGVGRVVNGFSGRVDRLEMMGNAVVPVIPELLGHLIMEGLAK